MTEIAASNEEIQKVLRDLENAIELASKAEARIERVLRSSRERRERIVDDLRRAGLIRD